MTDKTGTTNGKRIIDGLKDAVAYAKGDKSKGQSEIISPPTLRGDLKMVDDALTILKMMEGTNKQQRARRLAKEAFIRIKQAIKQMEPSCQQNQ